MRQEKSNLLTKYSKKHMLVAVRRNKSRFWNYDSRLQDENSKFEFMPKVRICLDRTQSISFSSGSTLSFSVQARNGNSILGWTQSLSYSLGGTPSFSFWSNHTSFSISSTYKFLIGGKLHSIMVTPQYLRNMICNSVPGFRDQLLAISISPAIYTRQSVQFITLTETVSLIVLSRSNKSWGIPPQYKATWSHFCGVIYMSFIIEVCL